MKTKLLILALSFFWNNTCVLLAQNKPNILLIMADDLNDFIGVMNTYEGVKTPNIDKLAGKGSLFTNAHSNAPICAPSRSSMFLGIYPHRSGNLGFKHWRKNVALANSKTIMEQLRDHGYQTAGAGKLMHHTWKEAWDDYGLRQDYTPIAFDGEKKVGHPSVPEPFRSLGPLDATFARLSDVPVIEPSEDYPGHSGWYSFPYRKTFRYVSEDDRDRLPDEKTADWAIEKLKDWDSQELSQPFFLGVGFIRPHTPLVVPDRFFDLFPLEEIVVPKELMESGDDVWFEQQYTPGKSKGKKHFEALMASYNSREVALKRYLQAYLASIAFMDDQVGRVLDQLNQTKFEKNTVIIFTSDHGYTLGEKDNLFKNNLWESSTRVPLIISIPTIDQQQEISTPVSLIDVYPTICSIANANGDNRKNENGLSLDGKSLIPLMMGKDNNEAIALTMVKGKKGGHNYAVRTERWRYILYENGQEELYDHQLDQYEQTNLASDLQFFQNKKELKLKMISMVGEQ
ncbi:MAG: sulfatase [Reichenbachiella sp.]